MNKLTTTLRLLWNKGVAITLLAILLFQFTGLSEMPFGELVYGLILITTVIVTAPIIRLLVFPSASQIAESGELRRLLAVNKTSPALMHYWIATFLSYAVTLVCVSSLI